MGEIWNIFFRRAAGMPVFMLPLLAAGFLAGVISLAWAAVEMRPLASDGANFIYGLLVSQNFVMDSRFWRYIDFLPQAPAILIFKVGGADALVWARAALMFSYSLFTALGTAVAVWLCFHYKKPRVALGPLLAFGLVCLPTAAFSLSIVGNSLAIFWPLFLIQTYGGRSRAETVALIGLSVMLAFGHETSIAFSALLLLFAVLQRYPLAASLHALGLGGYAVRLLFTSDWLKGRFFTEVSEAVDPNQVFLAAFLGILVVAVVAARFLPAARHRVILWLLAVVSLVLAMAALKFFTFNPYLRLASAVSGRATATVFVSVIAFVTWWMDQELPKAFGRFRQPNYGNGWINFLAAAATLAMFNGTVVDFRLTRNWVAGLESLRTYVGGKPEFNCVQVDREFFELKLADGGIADFCLSHLWASIQPGKEIEKFVWVNPASPQGKPFRDVCEHLADNPAQIETNFRGPPFPISYQGFKYGFLP